MTKEAWSKWFWSDWRGEATLTLCSYSARGLWMECLALMADADPRGYLLIAGAPPDDRTLLQATRGTSLAELRRSLAELRKHRVCSVTDDKVLYSRRMVRDAARSERNSRNGENGGHPRILRGLIPKEDRERRYKKSDDPRKTQRILDRTQGRCYWCGVGLIDKWDGDGQAPLNLYHVDHVIPIRDGGGNNERNLVAACRYCNGQRAMVGGETIDPHPDFAALLSDTNREYNSDTNHLLDSDIKPQKPETRDQKPEARKEPPTPVHALMELWNAITLRPMPACQELTERRSRRSQQRLRERPLADWRAVIERIQASDFCRGENERGWIASFDWLLQPDVAVKVLEGKYDNRKATSGTHRPVVGSPEYYDHATDWFLDCKQLHEGKCGSSSAHRTRLLLDADKAERASGATVTP